MNQAIFLDRDGVLIKERGDYTWRVEDTFINEGVADALLNFRKNGYLLIVISNQGGIAKEIYSHRQLENVHAYMEGELKKQGIVFDEIYYCPHHPSRSKCLCRKPDSLLLEKAIARFNIDRSLSYFIGDADRDIEAGKKAGVNTIKVESNESLLNVSKKLFQIKFLLLILSLLFLQET